METKRHVTRGRTARRLAAAAGAMGLSLVSLQTNAEEAPATRRLDVIEVERLEAAEPFRPVSRWTVPGRPSLALALSGGGARGVAHVGVLQALQEDGVEIDAIAGTSFGALVGAFVCAGYWPDEFAHILRERDWDAILADLDLRHRVLSRVEDLTLASPLIRVRLREGQRLQIGALVDNRPLERELYRYLLRAQLESGGDFDRLRCRFRPVATDVITGQPVRPSSGDLVALVRGSSAVPGVFRPVHYGSALLVDGGLVENVPVDTARATGADVVLAVDVSDRPGGDPGVRSAFDLLNRSLVVLVDARTRELLSRADVALSPDVRDFGRSAITENVDELVEAGRQSYREQREAVWEVLERAAGDDALIDFDRIEVAGTSRVDAETIAARLGGAAGEATRFRVAAELARCLNLGPFEAGRVEWLEAPPHRVIRFVFVESAPIRSVRIVMPERFALELDPGTEPDSPEAARVLAWRARQQLIERGSVLVSVRDFEWDPEAGEFSVRVADASVGRITVSVSGNAPLRQIQRLLANLQGERFDYDRLTDRLDEAVVRGSIREWAIEPRPGHGNSVDLVVHVRGDDYYELAGSAEFRDELGWGGYVRAAKSNITGRGDFADVVLAGAEDTGFTQVRYRTEYGLGFQNLGAEAGLRLFDNAFPVIGENQQPIESLEEKNRGSRVWVGLIRRLRWGVSLQGGLFREGLDLDPTPNDPGAKRDRSSVFLRVDLDRTDRLLFPTRGGSLRIQAEKSVSGHELWKAEILGESHVTGGRSRRQTVTFRGAIGLSEGADRRPLWFNPGGHRSLYGFIPYGSAAPQYRRVGATWRFRWFRAGPARVYLETGADMIQTGEFRSDLPENRSEYGYGASLVAHTEYLGPIALGYARNEAGASILFLTFGYSLFDR